MTGGPFDELRRSRKATHHLWAALPAPPRSRQPPEGDADLYAITHDPKLKAIAQAEGWLVPPAEVTRVRLRPWQEAVFWGLRIYIVLMLVLMAVGFAHVAGGK
ncbi:MAG: hypothetical protein JO122_05285 [Acetobacteraceae bacterium]|nr:hypothetical protein [Acetobacteraceae bacterium]